MYSLWSIVFSPSSTSEIMAEGFFIPGVAMIFLKKKLPLAGLLSLSLGGGFSLIGFLCEMKLLSLNWPAWPYSVPYGLSVCLAGFLTGYFIEKYIKTKKA